VYSIQTNNTDNMYRYNSGYVDPNNPDQIVAVGSSQGDPDLIGNPGYEVYTIPVITETGGIGGLQYVDPNTGGNAPGYAGDYVTGAAGSGDTDYGQDGYGTTNVGKDAVETYIITSDTQIDPNTGGNMPGYPGSYVTPAGGGNDGLGNAISSLVNLTEEFLGDNDLAGSTTLTEPSTTTSSTIVTSIATRAKQ